MQQIQTEYSARNAITVGKLLATFDIEDNKTLKEDAERFELLRLVKQAGEYIGFTPRMVALLELYIMRTYEQDWKQGQRPIVYQGLAKTAFEMHVSERQIQKLENALADLGAITWNSSSNNKRHGYRDRQTQEIVEAYGVDLTPLSSLKPILIRKLDEAQARYQEWIKLKKQISFYRGNIRKLISGLAHIGQERLTSTLEEQYSVISHHIRIYMPNSKLTGLLKAHKSLYSEFLELYEDLHQKTSKSSIMRKYTSLGELNIVHIQYTNQTKLNKLRFCSLYDTSSKGHVVKVVDQELINRDKVEDSVSDNIGNITWKQVLNSSSERFREFLPLNKGRLDWEDIVEAAYRLLPVLGISQDAWWSACEVLGRFGAAITIIIIDVKAQETDPELKVYRPGGYLRAMVNRAKSGNLNLQKSVFGLLKRDEEKFDA